METAIKTTAITAPNFGLENVPQEYQKDVVDLLFASMSASTRRVYTTQFLSFAAFAVKVGSCPMPASSETVAAYVAELVRLKKSVSTIQQTIAAIKKAHELKSLADPTNSPLVTTAMKGARRTLGIAPKHSKAAATDDIVRELVAVLDRSTIQGKRDAAIILLGFFGAFRRSELAALNVEDFQETIKSGRPAYLVTVRRSKTDQEGAGMVKGIFATRSRELDPIAAIKDYQAAAGITSGALFRRTIKGGAASSDGHRIGARVIANIIKRTAKRAGITVDLSGHSLRSGFITSALSHGENERAIMNQSGHKSVAVMRSYQRRENALSDNAASGLAASL